MSSKASQPAQSEAFKPLDEADAQTKAIIQRAVEVIRTHPDSAHQAQQELLAYIKQLVDKA